MIIKEFLIMVQIYRFYLAIHLKNPNNKKSGLFDRFFCYLRFRLIPAVQRDCLPNPTAGLQFLSYLIAFRKQLLLRREPGLCLAHSLAVSCPCVGIIGCNKY